MSIFSLLLLVTYRKPLAACTRVGWDPVARMCTLQRLLEDIVWLTADRQRYRLDGRRLPTLQQ